MTDEQIKYLKIHRERMDATQARDALDEAINLCEKHLSESNDNDIFTVSSDLASIKATIMNCLNDIYNKGHADGYLQASTSLPDEYDCQSAYEDGLNAAWECAKKIELPRAEGGLSYNDVDEVFGESDPFVIFKKYTAQECIDLIKKYEEKKSKKVDYAVEVGDEIANNEGDARGIVTRFRIWGNTKDGGDACILWDDGVINTWTLRSVCEHKTGRRFPEIVEIMSRMKEGVRDAAELEQSNEEDIDEF